MRTLSRVLILAALSVAGMAAADRAITVDGNTSDWQATALANGCFQENAGDASGGVDLTQVCVENDNGSASVGSLYVMFQASGALPTNAATWFGLAVDLDKNGYIDDTDEVYAVSYSAGSTGSAPSGLQVYSGASLTLKRSYGSNQSCAGKKGALWAGARNAASGVVEMSIPYSCIGTQGSPQVPLAYGDDSRLMSAGAELGGGTTGVLDQTQFSVYNGTLDVMTAPVAPPDVSRLTAVAQQATIRLAWTNPPTNDHKGVLVLRATSGPPNTAPTNGTTYIKGRTLGNATVMLADDSGNVSSLADAGLTNGTRYYYRVYNHANNHTYSTGNVPTSSGISGTPTDGISPNPAWCYSTGLVLLTQPSTQLGSAVFIGGGQAAVSASRTTPSTPTTDGTEVFRPAVLKGTVQSRFPLVSVLGPGGTTRSMLVVGDAAGTAYAIDPATGSFIWPSGTNGVSVGAAVVASAAVQLHTSNAAFQAVNPSRDLLYFATSSGNSATNRVVALSSVDGSVAWTYQPGDLGDVSGGMVVDTATNRLWLATAANGGSATVRVLDTAVSGATGQLVASFSGLGGITSSMSREYGYRTTDPSDDQMLVANTSGTVYGLSPTATGASSALWSFPLGSGLSSYPFPTGGAFIASIKNLNQVAWYGISGTTVAQGWSTTIQGPSGIRIDYPTQKVFVGSSDGNLYQLDVNTGAIEKTVPLGSQVGMPTIDTTANRLHVGTADGRLCSYQLPFP